jgi:hypothetical protein
VRWTALTCLCGLGACGGETAFLSDPDSGATRPAMDAEAAPINSSIVTGSVDGTPFALSAAIAQNSGPTAVGTYPWIRVELLELPAGISADCVDVNLGRALRIYAFNARDQAAIGPGTYVTPDGDGGGAGATIFAGFFWHHFFDAGLDKEGAGPGSVTFTEVTGATIHGSFEVTLEDNSGEAGQLSGSFITSPCP